MDFSTIVIGLIVVVFAAIVVFNIATKGRHATKPHEWKDRDNSIPETPGGHGGGE